MLEGEWRRDSKNMYVNYEKQSENMNLIFIEKYYQYNIYKGIVGV